MDDSTKVRYNIILDKYLLTELRLHLNIYEYVIEAGDGPLKGSTELIIDLGAYWFKYLNNGGNKPEEYSMTAYLDELYES